MNCARKTICIGLACVLCIPILGGCLTAPNLGAPTNPTPDVIKARIDHLTTIANEDVGDFDPVTKVHVKARDAKLSPSEYARAGYTVVHDACNTFFDVLARRTNGNQLSKADWTALGTAAATILALAHTASTKPVGITAAAFGLGAVAYDNYQKYALLTPYPEQTRTLVFKALDTYSASAPPEAAADMIGADARVSGYAAVCTYSSIVSLAQNAIASGTTSVAETAPGASIFTSSDDTKTVQSIQNTLGLSSVPSDLDLANLALMADTDDAALQAKIAAHLSDPVNKAVWDGTAALPLFNNLKADLAKLQNNAQFAKMVADSKASSSAATAQAKAAATKATPAGATAPVVVPAYVAPAPVTQAWRIPSIVINAPKSQEKSQ